MKILITGLILMGSISLKAQESPPEKIRQIQCAYFGEFITHPGLTLGLSKDFYVRDKIKSNGKLIHRAFLFHHQIGIYTQRKLETGLFAMSSVGYRKTKPRGYQTTFHLGVGVHHGILTGTTYEVDDNGNVSSKKMAGNTSFISNLAISIGKDFSKRSNLPISVHWKNGLLFKYPINRIVVPQLYTELGLGYQF